MNYKKIIFMTITLLAWILMTGCELPTVEEITEPGEIRIWFTYDLGQGTAFEEIVQEGDSLKVICTNFRLFNDTNYTDFYQEPNQFRQDRTKAVRFNILSSGSDYVKIAHG